MIEHNGKQYARVSDILRPFTDFKGIDPEVLQRKADIGTSVHQAIADEIAGAFPTPVEAGQGYFDSFLEWCYEFQPNFVLSEKRFFCDEKRITGQIDALVRLEGNSGLILVDFKTSVKESPTWPLQAHLYAYLVENDCPLEPEYLFVKLDKKGGKAQVFGYKRSQDIHQKCMQSIDDFWKLQLES